MQLLNFPDQYIRKKVWSDLIRLFLNAWSY
jgi:hypothetical protein